MTKANEPLTKASINILWGGRGCGMVFDDRNIMQERVR